MITDSQLEIEKFFLTYKRILYRFEILGIKTKSNKNVTYADLA